MFLENTINKYTMKPVFSDESKEPVDWLPREEMFKPKLATWVQLKSTIWEIYDHRIHHAPEINGAINTSYMTLEEHLLVFMLDKHKNRVATERAMVEFLASLKYYVDSWQRAKVYAQLLGIITNNETFLDPRRNVTSEKKLPMRLNNGLQDETELGTNDIYLQEFYLYAYNMIQKDRKNFVES
jgi:hypothetical protein